MSVKVSTFYQLKGYPGLHYMAEQISRYFPDNPIHVEPFAGLGRTIPFSKSNIIILNDKSDYAVSYLKETYPKAVITQEDFSETIKKHRENPDVFLFLDPPWRKNIYKNNKGPEFTMKNVTQYYQHIFYWLNSDKTKCKWMLCSDRARTEISSYIKDIGYFTKELVHAKHTLYGRLIGVKIVTNYPLIGDNQ